MDTPERPALVRELEREFNRLFVRRRFNALQLARRIDPEIEPASYSVLATLQNEGPARMTSIARHLGIGKPTLSRQLTTLVSRGWVSKETDPADGRAQTVSLTAEGRERLETAQQERADRYLMMLQAWSQDEIETLSTLVAKLNRTYAEHDPAGPGLPRSDQDPQGSAQPSAGDGAAIGDE
ncbi:MULTISPECIES: MarR family winged helix-turn-helix transcriptional regulator [Nesterenkonia]|uniref:DNA-binding MarR family transcriptional regulator n=1 Tax=Nesterenkonia xinjiangensis TaxID=225327 RepID=A0A7Z0GNA4_9MICC|nr:MULTISPECIES: MarR family transcriptional regulator [Nesterenkonia]MDZ5076063.1 MarR family transcriptional regulator [Nesterenkonia sp. HG001]NYJ79154.1 DNA-binding MarR family transcriptional regulator [Nesterenkonia xinjiangensis]